MGLNKRLMPGASAYATVSPFQNNVASYSSASINPVDQDPYLNNNPTSNRLFEVSCPSSGGTQYNFGANGSSEANNTVVMTMKGPTTTNGLTSSGYQASYYNYTGYLKWYGSNDGTNWTLLVTHHHTGGSLSAYCSVMGPTSYTAVAYTYYKVSVSTGTRGTYGSIAYITPSVVT